MDKKKSNSRSPFWFVRELNAEDVFALLSAQLVVHQLLAFVAGCASAVGIRLFLIGVARVEDTLVVMGPRNSREFDFFQYVGIIFTLG